MTSQFELAEIGYVKRIVVGNAESGKAMTEDEMQQQMALLNRCLSGTPRCHILNVEKTFGLHTIGDHQLVLQYTVYHVGFARKPSYLDEQAGSIRTEAEAAPAAPAVVAAAADAAVQPGSHGDASGDGITLDQLLQLLERGDGAERAAKWLAPLNTAMRAGGIDTPGRRAAFLAQVLVESGELQHCDEALNYSAARLRMVWPQHFPNDEVAMRYAHNPQALANRVYANRMGNGNEDSGDGWRYRGRGLIQMTGRDNYAVIARDTGLDVLAEPDLLLEPDGAARSAAWFWSVKGLNALADAADGPHADSEFDQITRRVNGVSYGRDDRLRYWLRALRAFGLH